MDLLQKIDGNRSRSFVGDDHMGRGLHRHELLGISLVLVLLYLNVVPPTTLARDSTRTPRMASPVARKLVGGAMH